MQAPISMLKPAGRGKAVIVLTLLAGLILMTTMSRAASVPPSQQRRP